jgi:hypothetical protein
MHITQLESELTETPCPLCEFERPEYLLIARQRKVYHCPACGLVTTLSTEAENGQMNRVYGDMREARAACLTWLERRGHQQGHLLLLAPEGHPLVSTIRSSLKNAAHTLSVISAEMPEVADEKFEACLILHQLEHSPKPLNMLERVWRSLKSDGEIGILTTAFDTYSRRRLNNEWAGWAQISCACFSRQTIQLALWRASFDQVWVEQSSADLFVTARRKPRRERPLISIIVPVYNEAATFPALMKALLAKRIDSADKEIIVVEDGSTDGTHELALDYARHPAVRLLLYDQPLGKGNAVRRGLKQATGDVAMIQDADLEYDLNDYDQLLEPLLKFRAAFVLGARHGGSFKIREFVHQPLVALFMNIGHVLFTTSLNRLYGGRMRDPFTMHKLFRRDCLHRLRLECNGFDFDHELVIKFLLKGYQPLEIPVNYRSRTFREGKKISVWRDPWTWIYAHIRFRFVSPFTDEES